MTMKNHAIRLLSFILALCMCTALLGGCKKDTPDALEDDGPVFDPTAYVQGGLDAVYMGSYSPEYLAMLGESEEDCAARYERGMQVSLEVFACYFGIDMQACSDDVLQRLTELMRSMYKCAKYTVGTAAETDGGYTVEVTVSPLAAISQVTKNDYPAFASDAAERLSNGELSKADSSFGDWWANSIADMVQARINAAEYLEPQTVTVTLSKTESGVYGFSGTSLSDIDALIVTYPT